MRKLEDRDFYNRKRRPVFIIRIPGILPIANWVCKRKYHGSLTATKDIQNVINRTSKRRPVFIIRIPGILPIANWVCKRKYHGSLTATKDIQNVINRTSK